MGLWGHSTESRRDPVTGATEADYVYNEDTEWSWSLVGLRVLLTPFTLVLDCLTMPAQEWLWGDGESDDST